GGQSRFSGAGANRSAAGAGYGTLQVSRMILSFRAWQRQQVSCPRLRVVSPGTAPSAERQLLAVWRQRQGKEGAKREFLPIEELAVGWVPHGQIALLRGCGAGADQLAVRREADAVDPARVRDRRAACLQPRVDQFAQHRAVGHLPELDGAIAAA